MFTEDDLLEAEEIRLQREFTKERWEELRNRVLNEGGIHLTTSDHEDLPQCLRRREGLPIDVMAAQFDFAYADDFVRELVSAHDRYKRARAAKIPRIPRHFDYPMIQSLLDQYYELWKLCCEVRARYGSRKHPAARSIYAAQCEMRRQYQNACKAAGIDYARV